MGVRASARVALAEVAKKKTSRKPPARSSTTDRVAESLRGRIADGDLAPGQRIIELDVSHDLGVSRSPIREALLRLVEEGLVTILPYRGAIVSPLRRERLVELLEFRLVMERFAIERMIERADLIFATAQPLIEKKSKPGRPVILFFPGNGDFLGLLPGRSITMSVTVGFSIRGR